MHNPGRCNRSNRPAGRAPLPLAAGVVASFLTSTAFAQVPINWITGSGIWSNPLKWNPNQLPTLPSNKAVIAASGSYTVTLDIPAQIVGIDLTNPSATLSMNPGTVLAIGSAGLNTGLTNNGTLLINGSLPPPFNPPNTAMLTQLRFPAGVTISGTGLIRLNADASTLDSAFISADSGFTWTNSAGHTIAGSGRLYGPATNNGSITADQAGRILQVAGDLTNAGTLAATTGILELAQGARVAGGSINTGASGLLRIPDIAGIASLTLTGAASISPGARLEIGAGTIGGAYDVLVNQNATNASTAFVAVDSATLGNAASSTTTLNANPTDLDSAILASENGPITIGPTHTIRGSGRVYANLQGAPKLNATFASKTLEILGDVNMTGGGSIAATAASSIVAIGGTPTITGGSVSPSAGATARIQDFASPLFKATSFSGSIEVRPGARPRLDTGAANTGTILINSAGTQIPTGLRFTQNGSMTGAGNITLNANPADLDSALIDGSSGVTLTNGIGHTIRGTGRIALPVTNQGAISANNPNGPLQLRSNVTNSGGSLSANNATLQLANAMTINGGSFTSFGTGRLSVAQGETATLSAFTNNTGATTHVMGGGLLQFVTSLTNNGTIVINPAGDLQITRLRATSDAPLSGSGTLTLNANPSNLDSAILESAVPFVIAHGATHTITGQGRIYAEMTNAGLIAAGSAGQSLEILGPVVQSAAGRIRAGNGRLALRSGAAISGGEFSRTGTGRLTVDGSASASSLRSTTPIDVAPGSIFNLSAFTSDNEIVINPNSGAGATRLVFDGTQTLLGTGSITLNALSEPAVRARLDGPVAPALLTLNPNQTLRGIGSIGGNVLVQGLIAPGIPPNGTGTLYFDGTPSFGSGVTLDLQFASASAYDSLVITNPYTLTGLLKVTLVGGFNPLSINLFRIIDGTPAAVRTGGFSTFNLPTPPPSPLKRAWRLNYLPTDVTLRLTCASDFNGDGVVDDVDFQYFSYAYNNLECPTPESPEFPLQPEPCPADLNDDGVVIDDDFVIFIKAYNAFICQ